MEVIGKYQVHSVLGRGGMGTVYEALDPGINRKVALKTMIQGLADNAELRSRFMREAQAAGKLHHRNIVTVYDLGEDKGQPYIAMEFIEGSDLEKIIASREGLSVEWKLDILRQICEGLGYAHRNGIVHRDIKPANIRVTPEGEVKIMDFGIAHLQSSTMTKGGLVLGTVHYMAPEQIVGTTKVDHRADVFSVGAIAYELFGGRKPFDGESITSVMYKIMHERPDPAALPKTEFSPGLESIVMKALAREVSERYQSLDEMHDELEQLVRDLAARMQRGGPEPEAEREPKAALARVEQESAEIRAEMERAVADGQLQKALGLCKRLLELDPGDAAVARTAAQIETSIKDKEVEQLCGLALNYAADGDTDLALKIAAKIERLAPKNQRYLDLKRYLDEESNRRTVEALTATARDHLGLGNLAEAKAAAEEALAVNAAHAPAREIRDRVAAVLESREKARAAATAPSAPIEPPPAPPAQPRPAPASSPARVASPAPSVAPAPRPAPAAAPVPAIPPGAVKGPAAPRPAPAASPVPRPAPVAAAAAPKPAAPATATATPLPVSPPTPPVPAPVPSAGSRPAPVATSETPAVKPAQPPPSPAAAPAARAGGEVDRKAEVESLTTAALNHFVQNNYAKARKAVDKALALDPQNKKAKELLKILGALS